MIWWGVRKAFVSWRTDTTHTRLKFYDYEEGNTVLISWQRETIRRYKIQELPQFRSVISSPSYKAKKSDRENDGSTSSHGTSTSSLVVGAEWEGHFRVTDEETQGHCKMGPGHWFPWVTHFFPSGMPLYQPQLELAGLQLTCPFSRPSSVPLVAKPSQPQGVAPASRTFVTSSSKTHLLNPSTRKNSFFLRVLGACRDLHWAVSLSAQWWDHPPCLAHASVAEALIR